MTTTPSLALTLACAHASLAAYEDDELRRARHLAGAGLAGGVLFSRAGAQALLCRWKQWRVLAWRGTETAKGEIPINLDWAREEIAPGVKVHRGYHAHLLKLSNNVIAAIKRDAEGPTVYCGHSLGGAVVTLLSLYYTPDGVISFGAPKSGNAAFWRALRAPVWRIVEPDDFAPAFPSWFGIPRPGYAQGGTELRVDVAAGRLVPAEWRPLAPQRRQDRTAHELAARYVARLEAASRVRPTSRASPA